MKQNEKLSIGQRWDELQPSKAVVAWACVATVAAISRIALAFC